MVKSSPSWNFRNVSAMTQKLLLRTLLASSKEKDWKGNEKEYILAVETSFWKKWNQNSGFLSINIFSFKNLSGSTNISLTTFLDCQLSSEGRNVEYNGGSWSNEMSKDYQKLLAILWDVCRVHFIRAVIEFLMLGGE